MAIQFGTTFRNAALDEIETVAGTSARLLFYATTAPATCASTDLSSAVVNILLPADWLTAATAGSKTLNGVWSGASTGSASTAPGLQTFRLWDNTATVCHMQGSVSSSTTADMVLNLATCTSGDTITVSSFTLSISGA